MKLTVKRREQQPEDMCIFLVFTQEEMPGLTLTEYDVQPFTKVLETIGKDTVEFFHESVGVRRQSESVTIVRRYKAVDEVLLKLTHGKAQKLASSLRAAFPEYF